MSHILADISDNAQTICHNSEKQGSKFSEIPFFFFLNKKSWIFFIQRLRGGAQLRGQKVLPQNYLNDTLL